MIRVVILDNEQSARHILTGQEQNGVDDIQIVGQADSVQTSIDLIERCNPDLVLLETTLSDGTGFDVLQHFMPIHFKVIFITACLEHINKAFEFCAIDYFIKPVIQGELRMSISQAFSEFLKKQKTDELVYRRNEGGGVAVCKKLVLNTADCIFVLRINEIVRCQSDGAYTIFFLRDGRKIMVSKILKHYDEILKDRNFLRIHQSHLINLDYIESFSKQNGGCVMLKDKSVVPVSSRKKEILLSALENM